jgi:hypothetical protein
MAILKKTTVVAKPAAKPAAKVAAKPVVKATMTKGTITGNKPNLGVFKTKITRPDFDNSLLKPYEYTRESIDTTGYSKGKEKYNLKTVTGEGDAMRGGKDKTVSNKTIYKKDVPSILKSLKKKK